MYKICSFLKEFVMNLLAAALVFRTKSKLISDFCLYL